MTDVKHKMNRSLQEGLPLWGSIITASQAFIRGTHPSSYRSGQWALIEGVNWITTRVDGVSSERVCYRIRFQDGAVDYCPVFDDDAGYEFTGSVTNRWPS